MWALFLPTGQRRRQRSSVLRSHSQFVAELLLILSLGIPGAGLSPPHSPPPTHTLKLYTNAVLCVDGVIPDNACCHTAEASCRDAYVKPGEA